MYTSRFARLINSGRLPDRYLTCQIQKYNGSEDSNLGTLFFMIEITTNAIPSGQIGQTIVNTLSREYFRSTGSSELTNFENALKKVNEILSQVTQSGNTEWIGNLNASVALLKGNDLHITQTGDTNIFLLRENTISRISTETSDSDPHPLKAFNSITSGTLESSDKIIFSNSALSEIVTEDDLRLIIGQASPKSAILNIARILQKEKVREVNVLVFELLTEEQLSSQPLEDIPSTMYIDKPLESSWSIVKRYYTVYLLPLLNLIGRGVKIGASKSYDYSKTKVLPTLKKHGSAIGHSSLNASLKMSQQLSQKVKSKTHSRPLEESYNENGISINHYADRSGDYKPYSPMSQKNSGGLKAILKPRILAVIVIGIIIVVIGSKINNAVKNRGNNAKGNTQATTELTTQVQDKIKLAQGEKDPNKALDILKGAEEIIASSNSESSTEATSLKEQINTEINKLFPTTTLSGEELVGEFSDSNRIFIYENTIYSFSNKTNKISTPSFREKSIVAGGLPESAPAARFSYYDSATARLYIQTSDNKFYYYDLKANKAQEITSSGGWAKIDALSPYSDSLYVYDSSSKNIFKYPTDGENKYKEAIIYSKDKNADLDGVLSLAIDTYVYALNNEGEVIKLAKGNKQDFKVTNLPKPYDQIENPYELTIEEGVESIFIIEKSSGRPSRIVELNKQGQYQNQYLLPASLSNFQDIYLQPKAKKVWVLLNGKVYKISY